ncbi:ATP-binding cassette sub- A member 1 [Chytriomyces hyalinus]|nr:ATP-binding cassette sub- A member 1 [Chytriomyces hyalinus]
MSARPPKIPRQASSAAVFVVQMKTMLKRNSVLQLRYLDSTLAQAVIAPALFMLLLFGLQKAQNDALSVANPHPVGAPLDGVPACQPAPDKGCALMLFHPNTPETSQFMSNFAAINSQRTGSNFSVSSQVISDLSWMPSASDALNIFPVNSHDFIYNYALSRPNATRWAVTFDILQTPSLNVRYQVWYNGTLTANGTDAMGRELVSVIRGLDEAIITSLNGNTQQASLEYHVKDWPLIPAKDKSNEIVTYLGPAFFFCSAMIIFISILNQICAEKEAKLRHGMDMMGLYASVYWLSNLVSNVFLVLISSLLTVGLGIGLGFETFRKTDFLVVWLTFFLFGMAMVAFAFFLTTLFKTAKTAVILGIFIFVIGLVMQVILFSSPSYGYLFWDKTKLPPALAGALSLIPFFNFGHMLLDISVLTTGTFDSLTDTYIAGPGFQWAMLQGMPLSATQTLTNANLPAPVQAWYYLCMNIFLYYFLAWYLDSVLPDIYGNFKLPWFFLLPSYWIPKQVKGARNVSKWLQTTERGYTRSTMTEEEGVSLEREKALSRNNNSAVKIARLKKIFRAYGELESKHAVRASSFTVEQGSLLALLGQNGAGKSTTMAMLAGLLRPSGGDALVYGLSIATQMDQIRAILGVCPQHDILFEDLTAIEHIELYAGLKGLSMKKLAKVFEERLKVVQLWTVKDVRAGTYSGGMKRRLSLIIATIGDPKLLLMDEPTTGMDPVNRRHVWAFIEKFKKDRAIILTTHSMEEADVLGDKIAIMAHGKLCAMGDSISLKNKYGAGYRISIITSNPDEMKNRVAEAVPDAILEDDSAGALIYQFPLSSTSYIPPFMEWLEENADGSVKSWGVSQTTLEEVFLKLIREANPGGYNRQ